MCWRDAQTCVFIPIYYTGSIIRPNKYQLWRKHRYIELGLQIRPKNSWTNALHRRMVFRTTILDQTHRHNSDNRSTRHIPGHIRRPDNPSPHPRLQHDLLHAKGLHNSIRPRFNRGQRLHSDNWCSPKLIRTIQRWTQSQVWYLEDDPRQTLVMQESRVLS